jgi:hypothetical protein
MIANMDILVFLVHHAKNLPLLTSASKMRTLTHRMAFQRSCVPATLSSGVN